MSDKLRCTCRRCTIRGLMGPAIITTIGILFLLSEFAGHGFSFGRTFPVVLIVIGAILLASSLAPAEGHIDPSAPHPPAAPPANPYQGPQGQGQ
ncbi:MAG TPA: hypothetical protein VFP96_12270 [Candidatus Acidoferrum sp.]|nr:hypothetical protein [Candidatus Acidoferrum sp.]